MLKIEDIKQYIDDTMLDTIFRERKEELDKEMERENLEFTNIKKEYSIDYEKLLIAIKNLPPHFHNTREGIIKALENYSRRENLIIANNNEKFYKVGFCDGIRTILESIKKDNSK